MEFNGFFDTNNMIHVRQGEYSENGPLFTAEYWLARLLKDGKLSDASINAIELSILQIIEDGWFNPQPDDDNDENCHFSHDNMTGLYTLCKLIKMDCNNLPILKWNNRWWLHPRDLAFYSIMKENLCSKLFSLPLLALLLVMALHSCSKSQGITSGKMMWWVRWKILSLHTSVIVSKISKISWWICEKILERTHGKNPMSEISAIYFKEEGHPVRELLNE